MLQFTNAVEKFGGVILNELRDAGITSWIAGGAVRDYFAGARMNTDYDLFFPNEEMYNKASEHFKAGGCSIKWESENGMKLEYNGKTFDLVKKFFGTPRETIDAFDFTVSMLAVDTDSVYSGESTFIDLSRRQLMINKITYPASTLSRAFRYYKKGYSMCLGEIRKMVEAIQGMPVEEPARISPPENPGDASSGDSEFFAGID